MRPRVCDGVPERQLFQEQCLRVCVPMFSLTMFRLARPVRSVFVRDWTRQFTASSSLWSGKSLRDVFPDSLPDVRLKTSRQPEERPKHLEAGTLSEDPHLQALCDIVIATKGRKRGEEREMALARSSALSTSTMSASVRIFDVPTIMKEEDIHELFSPFGEIEDIILSTFHYLFLLLTRPLVL